MTKNIRRSTWSTYAITGYTYAVANDQASAGGVHCHQIRKSGEGWQKRILQSNGKHEAAGPVSPVSEAEGEALFARACTR